MNSRSHVLGRSVALPVALFCLSFTRSGWAQDDTPSGDPSPSTDTAPAGVATADATPAEPAPADTPPADTAPPPGAAAGASDDVAAAAAGASGDEMKPEPAPAPPAVPTPESTAEANREAAVASIGIERLPASAYPEPLPRGIKGGSLWLTMQGLQWPYMPMIAGEPATRIGISGSVWNDLSYVRFVGSRRDIDRYGKRWLTQGRAVLRVTPTHSTRDGWFAQGQAELVAEGDTSVNGNLTGSTDDLYVRVGKWNLFDVTVGRFQGWEVFHYGMGLDLNTLERKGARIDFSTNTPNDIYTFSYLWDRQELGLGYYALHLYPHKFVRFEVLGALGAGGASGTKDYETGVRPVGILDLGIVKFKAGVEYAKAVPQIDDHPSGHRPERNTRSGYGAALQLVLNPYVEAGVNFARSFEDIRTKENLDDIEHSNNTWTAGAFLNARVVGPFIVGGGALMNHWENRNPNPRPGPDYGTVDYKKQFLSFFALQYTAFDTLYFKFVGSHAFFKDHLEGVKHASNHMLGGRFRMMVTF